MKFISKIEKLIEKFTFGSNLKSKLIRDGIGSVILRIVFIFLSFFISVVLARILGVEGYGVYGYVLAIVSMLAIPTEFGLPTLVLRETSKNVALRNFGLVRGILGWASKIIILITIIIFVLAVFALQMWGNQFDEIYILTIRWGLLLVPIIALGNLKNSALKGLKKIVLGQLGENLIKPGSFLLIVLIIYFIIPNKITPNLVMIFHAIAAGISLLFASFMLRKNLSDEINYSSPFIKNKIWLFSASTLALVNGVSILNKWINLIILGLFVTSSQIGVYNVAIQISILASSGLQAINLVIAPQFASLYAQGDQNRLQRLTTISARVILAINLIITVFFIIFGRLFLKIVYGPEFEIGYFPMLILLIGQFFNSATGSVAFLLNMTDREQLTIRGSLAAVGINIALSFLLAPIWGTNGAAIATAIAVAISNIILWWLVYKHLKINSLAFNILKK